MRKSKQVLALIVSMVMLSASIVHAEPNKAMERLQPTCSLAHRNGSQTNPQGLDIYSNFVYPTVLSLIPQLATTAFVAYRYKDPQLGLDTYRGIKCFQLGVKGLQRLYAYQNPDASKSQSEEAVSNSKDLAVNQDMFGYLMADTIAQTAIAKMRPDLLVHHIMGLTLWGSTLAFGVMPDVIALNSAVEILSAFKGLEGWAKSEPGGGRELLQNQRIVKAAYLFRLAVISLVRFPMWTLVDWKVPDERFDELGWVGWGVYRTLNVGIIALETLWAYQTFRTFNKLRFF